jgi:hypothetical protein
MFLHGRPLSPDELAMIRQQIESFDDIGAVDDEIRGIVAPSPVRPLRENGPHHQPFAALPYNVRVM